MGEARLIATFLKWYLIYFVISAVINLFNPPKAKAEVLAYVHPLTNINISSEYGERVHPLYKIKRHHAGIDLKAPRGTDVRALFFGKVIFAGNHGNYGNLVSILHENNVTSHYAHLSKVYSKVGSFIKQGEVLGAVGSTGVSTGSHLHLELRYNGNPLNPRKILYALDSGAKG